MLRATVTRPGEIQFDDVPVPAFAEDEVLLKIHRIGICGSDIHVFHGKHPYTSYPVVQGHEFSGEVVACGNRVTSFKIGDLATAPPQIFCGECQMCRNGSYHICENLRVIGFQAPGTAQEFFVFSERKLLQLPREFTPEMGALVEPISVAVHAVHRVGSVEGRRVLVLGAGPIGNLVAQVCRWRGAADVVITDLSEYRLDIARQCGIAHSIQTGHDELRPRLEQMFSASGADVVLECVGAEETANQAIQCARKGATIVIVGVFGKRPVVDLGLVQDHELQLLGSLMYQEADFRQSIELLEAKKIITAPLLSRSFPFRQFLDAYRFLEANRDRVMKVFIDVDQAGA